jgi:hypothetical protein
VIRINGEMQVGEMQVVCRNAIPVAKKFRSRLIWPGHLGRMSDNRAVKENISGETRRKKKSRKTKINVAELY